MYRDHKEFQAIVDKQVFRGREVLQVNRAPKGHLGPQDIKVLKGIREIEAVPDDLENEDPA